MAEHPLQTPLQESEVPDVWRNEVQSRLERYKRRRGRRIEGAFTMRFPFPKEEVPQGDAANAHEDGHEAQEVEQFHPTVTNDAAATANPEVIPIATAPLSESSEEVGAEEEKTAVAVEVEEEPGVKAPSVTASAAPVSEPEQDEEPLRLIELPPRPMPRRKVIAFPAPSYAEREAVRRIADPVQPEQLRILDVPEELQAMPATPFLEGLLDAPAASTPNVRTDGVDLPCPALRASRRVAAASIDAVVTLLGVGLFGAAAARFMPGLPPTKFLIAGAVAISVLLWASYQYLFLVYRGRTAGMAAARVQLQTFKGGMPDFRQRQLRVIGLYLSVLSLGMGVLWYFVDVDSLCWQDRISQTFPAAADKS